MFRRSLYDPYYPYYPYYGTRCCYDPYCYDTPSLRSSILRDSVDNYCYLNTIKKHLRHAHLDNAELNDEILKLKLENIRLQDELTQTNLRTSRISCRSDSPHSHCHVQEVCYTPVKEHIHHVKQECGTCSTLAHKPLHVTQKVLPPIPVSTTTIYAPSSTPYACRECSRSPIRTYSPPRVSHAIPVRNNIPTQVHNPAVRVYPPQSQVHASPVRVAHVTHPQSSPLPAQTEVKELNQPLFTASLAKETPITKLPLDASNYTISSRAPRFHDLNRSSYVNSHSKTPNQDNDYMQSSGCSRKSYLNVVTPMKKKQKHHKN